MANELTIAGFADAYLGLGGADPDYEKIRAVSASLVPFGNHAGIEITEVGPDRAVAEIPALPHLTNHLGTVHAGAQFLAADIAGASAFVGAVAPILSTVDLLVLRTGTASFRKPATGRIRATGTVDEREMRRVLATAGKQRFELDGKALLHDESGVLVAKFTFEYVVTLG